MTTALITFPTGSTPSLACTFTDDAGALTNPATVTLTVKTPAGTTAGYTGAQLVHPSTGVYEYPYTLTTAGAYRVRWTSTAPAAVAELIVHARPSLV